MILQIFYALRVFFTPEVVYKGTKFENLLFTHWIPIYFRSTICRVGWITTEKSVVKGLIRKKLARTKKNF